MSNLKKEKLKLSEVVANDEGSSFQKVSFFKDDEVEGRVIKSILVRTNIARGKVNETFGMSNACHGAIYAVNGEVFTCDENTPGYDVRSLDDHQYSNGLVAINQLALEAAGFGGKSVTLATGLPIRTYYSGINGANKEIIAKKQKAFVDAEIYNDFDSSGDPTKIDSERLVTVKENNVLPEAIGAYIDVTVTAKGKASALAKELTRDVLVIDIGSFTTDIAIVGNGGQIRKDYIDTYKDQGFFNIYDKLRSEITKKHDIPEPKNEAIEEALKSENKMLKLVGKSRLDISSCIRVVLDKEIPSIINKIKIKLKDEINSLDAIIITGGGAEIVKSHFEKEGLAEVVIIPEDPQFANSRGYLKWLAYLSGKVIINDLASVE
jgi:plasmid segregation protein ParM